MVVTCKPFILMNLIFLLVNHFTSMPHSYTSLKASENMKCSETLGDTEMEH